MVAGTALAFAGGGVAGTALALAAGRAGLPWSSRAAAPPAPRGPMALAQARWPRSPAGLRGRSRCLRRHRRGRCLRAAQQFDPGDGHADDGQAHRQAYQREPASGLRRSSRTCADTTGGSSSGVIVTEAIGSESGKVSDGVTVPGSRTCVGSSKSESASRFVPPRGAGRAGRHHVRRLRIGVGGQRRHSGRTASGRGRRRRDGRRRGRTLCRWRGRAERQARASGWPGAPGKTRRLLPRPPRAPEPPSERAPRAAVATARAAVATARARRRIDNPPGAIAEPTIVERRLFAVAVNPGVRPGAAGLRLGDRRREAGRRRS